MKAIETAIPATEIEKAISRNKANEERNRSLPAHEIVPLFSLFLALHSLNLTVLRYILKDRRVG
ncbi:MAG: hypothetical protein C6Y22_20025 [Hapalosiphonaceae cyanobacterium JJU2]|nr:MAG: hypothetical protein C6Y22_20025 [Hapalosiphonaceae cyanobacterium JJU2]